MGVKSHPSFDRQWRKYAASNVQGAAKVAADITGLGEAKEKGAKYKKEKPFRGIPGCWELPLYFGKKNSVRLYFVVNKGEVWLIHLDPNKRRTNVERGLPDLLRRRTREVKEGSYEEEVD